MNHNWYKCRHHEVTIVKGKGPHSYELRCMPCNKHIQWLSTRTALHLCRDMNIAQAKIRSLVRASDK